MSYDTQASIKVQLAFMQGIFHDYAEQYGGDAFVVPDLVHLYKPLFDGSQQLKILIMYNGENVRGEFGIAAPLARVDRNYIVVVSRGSSLTFSPGAPLIADNQNAPPMFQLVEEVRDVCRGLMFDPTWTERPVDFKGTVPFANQDPNRVTDAWQVDFSVGVQLQLIIEAANQMSIPALQ